MSPPSGNVGQIADDQGMVTRRDSLCSSIELFELMAA
jgi:hypothetical protein